MLGISCTQENSGETFVLHSRSKPETLAFSHLDMSEETIGFLQ